MAVVVLQIATIQPNATFVANNPKYLLLSPAAFVAGELTIMYKTLQNLPIASESKVQLWLTLHDEKPVSTVRFTENLSQEEKLAVIEFIRELNLFTISDETSEEFIYVSKDKSRATETKNIMWKDDVSSIIRKGELFGYPKEATLEFANNRNNVTSIIPLNSIHNAAAYARYMVRKNNIDADLKIAEKWAELIRKHVPEIAVEFEKEMERTKIR